MWTYKMWVFPAMKDLPSCNTSAAPLLRYLAWTVSSCYTTTYSHKGDFGTTGEELRAIGKHEIVAYYVYVFPLNTFVIHHA